LISKRNGEDKVVATSAYGTAGMNKVFTGQPQTLCEASLVSAAQRGHQAAFGELCRRHAKRVFRTMLRITRNREDAEDAVQDSFLQAFVHLGKFDGRSAFSTWLTRIAINCALMTLRKRKNARFVSIDGSGDPDGMETYPEVPDRAVDPERRYLEHERKRILRDAIHTLRPSARRVIELQQLEERSMREAAQVMRISVPAAKSRLFHAKAALRKSSRLRLFTTRRSREPIHSLLSAQTASQMSDYRTPTKSSGLVELNA
jgi:RNA polymerase sigma factor (sigma-70 family)